MCMYVSYVISMVIYFLFFIQPCGLDVLMGKTVLRVGHLSFFFQKGVMMGRVMGLRKTDGEKTWEIWLTT